jgi:bacterioferritin-associated ferredoxin
MVICLCTSITDRCLAKYVSSGITDPRVFLRITRAGRCSAACRQEITRILQQMAANRSGTQELATAEVSGHKEEEESVRR